MRPRWQLSLASVAAEAGVTEDQARRIATAVLRGLHRAALVEQRGLTDAMLEAYFSFGQEACYHFVGLLEKQRLDHDPDLPWSETISRFAPHLWVYESVREKWLAEGHATDRTAGPEVGDQ